MQINYINRIYINKQTCKETKIETNKGVLLEYPTTTGFQWAHLKNGPYTYTVSGGNGRVF